MSRALPELLAANPPAHWRRARPPPVLVLHGSRDHQVSPEDNSAGILAAPKDGGNHRVCGEILPALNHGFQTASTGAPDEALTIAETIAPASLRRITRFARYQR